MEVATSSTREARGSFARDSEVFGFGGGWIERSQARDVAYETMEEDEPPGRVRSIASDDAAEPRGAEPRPSSTSLERWRGPPHTHS